MNGLLTLHPSMSRWMLAAGLGAAVALGAPVRASAQDDGGTAWESGHRHHRRGMRAHWGRMADELGLTEAQRAALRGVMTRAREQRRGLRELAPEERWAAMRRLHEQVRAEMARILTPEQQARAQALREEHRARGVERRLEHMRERLGLTPAQERQVRAILERSRAEGERIRSTTEPGEARRAALRALHDRTREAVRGVLTPEQQAQLPQRGRHRY